MKKKKKKISKEQRVLAITILFLSKKNTSITCSLSGGQAQFNFFAQKKRIYQRKITVQLHNDQKPRKTKSCLFCSLYVLENLTGHNLLLYNITGIIILHNYN